ncbi:MAG: hypothetical protein DRG39_03605 [Deltaproteobacteria bacterium]|nr:MAG: hypothetical protein DRG39_03605 [Deltaproteobacteria bacterium]
MYLNTQKDTSSNRPLMGAIIGFGGVAEHAHAPILKRDMRFCIKAIVEPDKKRANVAREIFPDARVYNDIDSLFKNEPLDFIDICTPPAYHAEIILKACKNRINIICEKPLVTHLKDLERILQASKEADVLLFCVNNWKYAPIWNKAIELTNNRLIGEVKKVSLTVLRTPRSGGGITDWRKLRDIAGGGILMDHGWHHMYFISSIIKEEPQHISARMGYLGSNGSALEDEVSLQIGYGCTTVELYLTWRASTRKNFGHIIGEKGEIIIRDDHLILNNNSHSKRYNFSPPLSKGSHHLEWMKPVINEFFEELRNTKKRGNNIKEAVTCLHLICLAYDSQKNGCTPIRVRNIFNE